MLNTTDQIARRHGTVLSRVLGVAAVLLLSMIADTALAIPTPGIIEQVAPTVHTGHPHLQRAASAPGSRACPPGYRGKHPNCRRIVADPPKKCRRGYVGKPPVCIRIVAPPTKACPRGYRGRYPKCRRIIADPPRACPRGYRGKRPNCRKIVSDPPKRCKRGTYGKWPNCKRRPTQPQYDIKTAKPKTGKRSRPKKRVEKVRPSTRKRRTITRRRTTRPAQNRTAVPLTDRRPNEIVVVLDRSVDVNAAFAIAQQYRLVRLEGQDVNLINARVQRYRIPDRRSIEDVLAELQSDPRIRISQPNYVHRLLGSGKETKINNSSIARELPAKAKLQFALRKLRIPITHELATGRNIRIAVIDSGVDTSHEEFANTGIESYNAVRHSKPASDAHGTSVAGVIGANGDLLGMAPAARVIAIRAFAREKGSSEPITDSFVLAHAFDSAHERKARILNLSFAGPHDPLTADSIDAAQQAGMIVVAAAGNNGPDAEPVFPAAYPDVIAVTGTDKQDRLYAKANRGYHVTVSAPGVGVFAPVPEDGYDFQTGTSFAAPHVSGLIALMLERRPSLSSRDIRNVLTNSAVDLGPPGPDPMFGSGQVDARATVEAVIAGQLEAITRSVALPTRPSVSIASD